MYKCANFKVCGELKPKDPRLCKGCHRQFGEVLKAKTETEDCPICTNPSSLIVLPKCGHAICGPCVKIILMQSETKRCPFCRSESFNETLSMISKIIAMNRPPAPKRQRRL
jgi:RNA polymerase subunit RPABC4/transcription elongation factor Spt4